MSNHLIQAGVQLYDKFNQLNSHIKKTALSAYAGQTAFFLMLSFFPFFIFLFSLIRYTPLTEEMVLDTILLIIPASFQDFVINIMKDIYQHRIDTLLPVSIITAVWLSSKAFISLTQGLNAVYEIEENRSYIKIRAFSLLYTIIFALMIALTLALLVFGNTLYFFLARNFPVLDHILLPLIILRPLLSFFVLFPFFLIMYHFLPNRKCTLRSQFWGAFLAASGWILFSYAYSYYIDHISNYSLIYGTMTIIAFLMLWLYICMYLIFFGGLVNYFVNPHATPSQL